jgi:hypothetical protein
MEKVVVFKDFVDALRAKELISLFKGCCMVPDEGWPLPAYRVKGEPSAVRGFAAYCAACFDEFVALD